MIQEYKDKVKHLLEKYPATRESDIYLWEKLLRMSFIKPEDITGKQLIAMMLYGDAPQLDHVSRCRRKLQSMYPELRAVHVAERRKSNEEVVKEELRNF